MANALKVVVRTKSGTLYHSSIVTENDMTGGSTIDEAIKEMREVYSDLSELSSITFEGSLFTPFGLTQNEEHLVSQIMINTDAIEALSVIPLTIEE